MRDENFTWKSITVQLLFFHGAGYGSCLAGQVRQMIRFPGNQILTGDTVIKKCRGVLDVSKRKSPGRIRDFCIFCLKKKTYFFLAAFFLAAFFFLGAAFFTAFFTAFFFAAFFLVAMFCEFNG